MIFSYIPLVEWSKAIFAVSGAFWGLYLPLIMGLSILVIMMESFYIKTGELEWKKLTKFWTNIFTTTYFFGLIPYLILILFLFFDFPANIWLTGKQLGIPLKVFAILGMGIQTFIMVVLFYSNRKQSGESNISILILQTISTALFTIPVLAANAFFNNPVGADLNPHTAFFEIEYFKEIIFSPFAVHKYLHTFSSGSVVACLFVLGIGARYLMKKKHVTFSLRSIVISSVFGLISSLFVSLTGDTSTYQVAQHQPMKLAAMEGLYDGQERAPLIAIGFLNDDKKPGDTLEPFKFKIEIPSLLSKLATRDRNAFVPGINDLLFGNYRYGLISVEEKMEHGINAIISQAKFNSGKNKTDSLQMSLALSEMKENFHEIGYGYLNKPEDTVPYVHIVFNSFHSMVFLGFYFIFLFLLYIILALRGKAGKYKILLFLTILSIPLGYFAYEMGWVLSEAGRQPWVIQEILPVNRIMQGVELSNVKYSLITISLINVTVLFFYVKNLLKQINTGPEK